MAELLLGRICPLYVVLGAEVTCPKPYGFFSWLGKWPSYAGDFVLRRPVSEIRIHDSAVGAERELRTQSGGNAAAAPPFRWVSSLAANANFTWSNLGGRLGSACHRACAPFPMLRLAQSTRFRFVPATSDSPDHSRHSHANTGELPDGGQGAGRGTPG